MKYEFKIPTRHGEWLVSKCDLFGVLFYSGCRNTGGWRKGRSWLWSRVEENAIPKSVRDRAVCFLKNPERFCIKKGSSL